MKLILFLFSFSALTMSDHNIQVAVFKIYQDSNGLMLSVDVDTDDLIQEMNLSITDLTIGSVEEYLNTSLSMAFDGEKSTVRVLKITNNDDHTEIVSKLTTSKIEYRELDIHNLCLVNIEGQSNIVELRLFNQERDFLMNSERTKITIEM